jgi:hypothetical protein
LLERAALPSQRLFVVARAVVGSADHVAMPGQWRPLLRQSCPPDHSLGIGRHLPGDYAGTSQLGRQERFRSFVDLLPAGLDEPPVASLVPDQQEEASRFEILVRGKRGFDPTVVIGDGQAPAIAEGMVSASPHPKPLVLGPHLPQSGVDALVDLR